MYAIPGQIGAERMALAGESIARDTHWGGHR